LALHGTVQDTWTPRQQGSSKGPLGQRQGQAILGNLVFVDEEDQQRQSVVESWETKYITAKKIDYFGT
jgi:hypothetical protein